MVEAGDRGAFHYSYYLMSDTTDALLTAKISTFSETVGGTAYAANWLLAQQFGNGGVSDDPGASQYEGIYYLSQLVAETILTNAIADRNSESDEGSGFLNGTEHFQAAQQAWDDAGNPEQFPGLFLDGAIPFFDGGTGATPLDVFNQVNPEPGITASRFGIHYADTVGKRLEDFEGIAGYTTIENGDSTLVTAANGRVVFVSNNTPTLADLGAVSATAASQLANLGIPSETREQFMSGLISGDLTQRVEKDGDLPEVIAARRDFDEFSGGYNGDPDPFLSNSYSDPSLVFRASGSDEDDILTAPDGGGTINGGAGNDLIFGDPGGLILGGDDVINGGEGDDAIWGFGGADDLNGGAGDDVVRGGRGADTIDGGEGADIIDGGSGHDDIFDGPAGNTDADYLIGGSGADEIVSFGGNDTVEGGSGADVLFYTEGRTILNGGEGNDYYNFVDATGTEAVVVLEAGFGRDVFSSNYSAVDRVVFEDVASTDVTFTWNYTVQTFNQGFFTSQFLNGEATITIDSTGDSLYLGNVGGQIDFDRFGLLNSFIQSFFSFEFTDGIFSNWNSLFGRPDQISSQAVDPSASTALEDHMTQRETPDDEGITETEELADGRIQQTTTVDGVLVSLTMTDAADSFVWASYTDTFDAGARTDRALTYDDGRTAATSYTDGVRTQTLISDDADQFVWSTLDQTFDGNGVRTEQTNIYDDGRVLETLYVDNVRSIATMTDIEEAYNWASYVDTYDDAGERVSRSLDYDDGRTAETAYIGGVRSNTLITDVADQFVWESLDQTFDASGTRIAQTNTYDDGRVLETLYVDSVRSTATMTDVEDAYNWASYVDIYDDIGDRISRTFTNDDGSEFFI